MKRLYLIILLLLSTVCRAQTDTAFWFAMPCLSDSIDSADGPITANLVFHTYDLPATIMVEQPTNSFFSTVTLPALPANSHTVYHLQPQLGLIETSPINTVLNRGFYIHSTAPITCYLQYYTPSNRETYTLKGQKALGTDFQILAPIKFRPNPIHDLGQRIEMIATEDSTFVTISPCNSTDTVFEGGVGVDGPAQIMLGRGQSYALRGNHYRTEIIKTKIHASHPIAVNTTSNFNMSRPQSGNPYTFNLAGEQLLPLPYWGTKYVRINHFTNSEMFRSAEYIDTGFWHTWRNGNPTGSNYGGTVWNVGCYNFFDSVNFIESDRPMGTMHQLDPNLQMGASLLPQIECAGSHQIAYFYPESIPISIDMIIESHAVGDILFNGDSTILTPDLFRPVPGLPSYSWCSVDVTPHVRRGTVMHISCSTSKFMLAVVESDSASGTSYTYLTDYAPYSYLQFAMDTTFCLGDSLAFNFTAYAIDSIAIHCPNGITLSAPPYVIPNADSSMSGQYVIESISNDTCKPIRFDTINISIQPAPTIDTADTINASQLPWSRFGITFDEAADTTFFRPSGESHCDSIFHYSLYVRRTIEDTVLYYACEGELPVQYGDSLFYHEGAGTFHFFGSHGDDSLVTFILHVIPNSDTTIYDTITEDQLPWYALDTVFTDSVADYVYHTYNEAGCDSLVHYNLYVFWNGDHCDTNLSYPNLVTPNGDGANDRFVIMGLLENNCFKYNELSIYDRTGRRVYHKVNIANESDWWDPAAHRIPDGTYFYYFRAHGIHIHTQHTGVIEVIH